MAKTVVLGGVEFELVVPKIENRPHITITGTVFNGRDLYSVYDRPSQHKQVIWSKWEHWALSTNGVMNFGVKGGNCNFFTISGDYEFAGIRYKLLITASHNRAILCAESE